MKDCISIYKDIESVFKKYGVEFWLEHGSLLGMIRNGEPIPGDDDIDLASDWNDVVDHIDPIMSDLYEIGYNVYITDVKLIIKSGKENVSVFLYKHGVVEGHHLRYRISKKNYMAHILLYGFLEGLKTPYHDFLHKPAITQKLIDMSKNLMAHMPAKDQLNDLIISFGKKINCLFVFDIGFPSEYIRELKKVKFCGLDAKVPIESEKYLEWMYGKNWRIPDKNYDKQYGFYDDMESYNTIRDLKIYVKKVIDLMNNNGINHWMYGGALLGYVRDGALIPWDKDIDLFVWKKDFKKIIDLNSEFKKMGFNIIYLDGGIMLKKNNINITIVHYTLDGDIAYLEKVCVRNKLGTISYYGILTKLIKYRFYIWAEFLKDLMINLNAYYKLRQQVPAHFFLELRKIKFLGLELNVPIDSEGYLEYTFGKDWRTPIKDFKYEKEYIYVIDGKLPKNKKYHSGSIQ